MISKGLMLTVLTVTLALCAGATLVTGPAARAVSGPSLQVSAPVRAQVGQPIKVKLMVKGASDVGGYETNLLFNTKAAQFASPYQLKGNLGASGRGAELLGPVEDPRGGVSIGAFSCSTRDCSKAGKGAGIKRGVGGTVRLATVTVVPTRLGRLNFKFDATKVVNAAGESVDVNQKNGTFAVQVGARGGHADFSVPKANSQTLKDRPSSRPGPFDLTGDGKVTTADSTEAALSWTASRESGSACATKDAQTRGRDVNHDGCIDVADLQTIADHYTTSSASSQRMREQSLSTSGASTFTVDSTADDADAKPGDGACATAQGACTLRAAIQEANRHPGPDTIAFNIPGTGVQTINIGSTLPTLSDVSGPTTIDGYTQPGSSPNTDPLASNAKIMVQITTPTKYASGIYGLTITSPGNTVRGLAVFGINNNIWLYKGNATNNTIAGDFVGTDATGSYYSPSYVDLGRGVEVQGGASSNSIGVASPEGRNVISGNGRKGVDFDATDSNSNRVVNNIIGLRPDGTTRVPNWKIGIDLNISTSQNQIGGTQQYEHNVISGNGTTPTSSLGQGIELSHGGAVNGNQVVGNFIGTDLTGNNGPAYAYQPGGAVSFEDHPGTGNVVSGNVIGNSGTGVRIISASYAQIRNNRIGVSLNGSPIPNKTKGVQINNVEGGTSVGSQIGPGNIIANNGTGVAVSGAPDDGNTITQNSIFGNVGLGIDLDPLGQPNPNDAGDPDSGPNQQLNFPVIQTATPLVIKGTACSGCTVEVFKADGGKGAYGEGKTFVGSAVAASDGTFAVPVTGVSSGDIVTSTATDTAGNTSEFSPNKPVS